ncbi:hypothetical protein [Filobacillus milosensis]|uniref:hypothetical protein n=1 Tax=Filobacillus milosensis TaxID=94137 RepID=UPI001E492BBD|nr:hypothetical protein [Filobacillus milosensis]
MKLEGELKVVRGDEGHILVAGEQIAVPKETNHMFLNASNQKPVTFRVKITPAHRFEDSMRILYGLMRDGKSDDKGIPKDKVHLALALEMQDSRMVELPFFLRYLMKRLVKKGKKKGIDQELIEKYAR